MRVSFHPAFAGDIRRFEKNYGEISPALAMRFRKEVDDAISAIISNPGGAGHFLEAGSGVVKEFRRRNLRGFPFFILYGVYHEHLILGAVIASRSDPLTWLVRFDS